MRGGNAVEKKGEREFKTLKSSEFPVAGSIQAKLDGYLSYKKL